MRKIVHKLSAITFIVVIVCLLSGAAVMAAQSVIPPPSIVNWWPGDGNAQDFMGGKHGILMNGAGFAGGKVGQAFSFDGINDYVSVGRTDFVNALTIEAWVYPKSFGAYSTIYARWYDGSWPDRGVVFQIKSNTHLRLGVINDSNILDGAYTFQVNQWYHVAGTWDGSTSRVYVNGVQVGNRSTSGTFTNQNINAAIGVDPVPAQYYFNGLIDEVSVYNRALSSSEIQAIYNAGEAGKSEMWNLPRELSGTQGYHNWYYYGHRQGTAFTPANLALLTFNSAAPASWISGSNYLRVVGRDLADWRNIGPGGASGWLHPGEYGYNNIAIGWKAPQAGTLYISGTVNTAFPDATASGGSDDGIDFSIYQGTARLAGPSQVFRGNNESNRVHSVTLTPVTTVNAGDMIYFYIDRRAWQDCDMMYYSFSVSYDASADLIAPVSSYGYTGNSLTLSATDTGSGVARIEYRTYYPAWTEWTQYTSPIAVSNGQKLMFRALDNAGNVEPYHRITVDTIPPTTTATSTPPANTAGWNNSDVTVTLTAVDNAGGAGVKEIRYRINEGTEIIVSGATASFALTTDGTHTISYSARDNFGNIEGTKSIAIHIDKTPPTISATKAPEPNGAGWNNTDVTVTFTAADDGSGVDTCSTPVTITTEGASQFVTGTATDKAGNTASITVSDINIDKAAPTLTFKDPIPAPNAAGWHSSDVSIAFSATDGLSGVASITPLSPLVLTGEGDNITGDVTVTDVAGNSATFTSPAVKIDKTPPVITINAPIAQDYSTSDNITIDYDVTDSLSGVASVIATLDGIPVSQGETISLADKAGNRTFTVTGTDVAGNTTTKSVTFSVIIAATVEINPDTLNTKSKGNPITAYIEFPEGYDVAQIDVATMKLSVNGAEIAAMSKPSAVGDCDIDGINDLMVKFEREALIAALNGHNGEIILTITGALTDGRKFVGTDAVRVLNR